MKISPLIPVVVLAAIGAGFAGPSGPKSAQGTQNAAATQDKAKPAPKPDPSKPSVMNGCVSADASTPARYMFTDKDGSQYRLTGIDAAKYSGQQIQIVAIKDTRRLRIAGGLTPTPNIAAQAGAIDPTKAAVAAAGGGTRGTGSADLPELKVSRVGAVAGACSQ